MPVCPNIFLKSLLLRGPHDPNQSIHMLFGYLLFSYQFYCLSDSSSLFITRSTITEMGPVNISPLPTGMLLSTINRGQRRNITRRKSWSSWIWAGFLQGAPGFSRAQWPVAFPQKFLLGHKAHSYERFSQRPLRGLVASHKAQKLPVDNFP